MFSGIVEEKGRVRKIVKTSRGRRLSVESKLTSKDAKIGDSISVSGICLTVVEVKDRDLTFDVMEETFYGTNLKDISAGSLVNLERSLKAGDRISGHFVTGHIDYVGKICRLTKQPKNYTMEIEIPDEKMAYVAEKGSIAIDGVSLTIGEVKSNRVKVFLIPLTLEATNLGSKRTGDPINIEFDILSKYSLSETRSVVAKKGISQDFLKQHGFL